MEKEEVHRTGLHAQGRRDVTSSMQKRKQGGPMADPRVKYSRVRLVASDKEEESVQVGDAPFRVCRFTSDQGIPVDTNSHSINLLTSADIDDLDPFNGAKGYHG